MDSIQYNSKGEIVQHRTQTTTASGPPVGYLIAAVMMAMTS